jgi:hypothetical protein
MTQPGHQEAFQEMRGILREHASDLVVTHDEPDGYSLDTPHLMPNRKPLFFGAAKIGKQYASFHLMPVYIWPELLDDVSPALRKRMQGKSCFNFQRPEPELFQELATLTQTAMDRCREHGYVR